MTRFQLILCEIEGWSIPEAAIPSLPKLTLNHEHKWYTDPVKRGYECCICKEFVSSRDIQMLHGRGMLEMSGNTSIKLILDNVVRNRTICP